MTDATPTNKRATLECIAERLEKVVYVEPYAGRGGRSLDGLAQLLADAKWMALELTRLYANQDAQVEPKGAA